MNLAQDNNDKYFPKDYWEKRLSEKFDITRTGTLGFSAEYNEWLYKAKVRALNKAIITLGVEIKDKSILDIGSGTGFFVDYYASFRPKDITGIDITNISVNQLRLKYPDYRFLQRGIEEDIDSNMGKFDIVNVFDVLYHIKRFDRFERAIANISLLVKNEGFIFITDLLGYRDVDQAEHVTFRGLETYKTITGDYGLEIISIIPMYFLLNRPFKMKRLYDMDKSLAPLFYFLDGFLLPYCRTNLKLLVARRKIL